VAAAVYDLSLLVSEKRAHSLSDSDNHIEGLTQEIEEEKEELGEAILKLELQ